MSLWVKKWPKPWFCLYFWFWFCLVWFWIGSNDLFEATIEFPRTSTCILYLTCHCSSKIGQTQGYIFGCGLVWFGFSFDFCQNHEYPCRAGCIDTSHSQIWLKMHEIQRRTDWQTYIHTYIHTICFRTNLNFAWSGLGGGGQTTNPYVR